MWRLEPRGRAHPPCQPDRRAAVADRSLSDRVPPDDWFAPERVCRPAHCSPPALCGCATAAAIPTSWFASLVRSLTILDLTMGFSQTVCRVLPPLLLDIRKEDSERPNDQAQPPAGAPAEASRLQRGLGAITSLRIYFVTQHDGLCLYLHQYFRSNQSTYLNHAGSRSDGPKELTVSLPYFLPVINVDYIYPRAHNIFERRANPLQSSLNVLEYLDRLGVRVTNPNNLSIFVSRGCSGNMDIWPNPHCSGVTHNRFPLRSSRDILSVHQYPTQSLIAITDKLAPNGQGLAAASRPNGTAFKAESGVKIAPILARSGRLQPIVRRRPAYILPGLLQISARIALPNRCSRTVSFGTWRPNAIEDLAGACNHSSECRCSTASQCHPSEFAKVQYYAINARFQRCFHSL